MNVLYKVTGPAVSGHDYTAPSGTAVFVAGATDFTLTIPTIDDLSAEGDETVTVTILPPAIANGYQVGSANSATATIQDNEPTVTIQTLTEQPTEQPKDSFTIGSQGAGFAIKRRGSTKNSLIINIGISGTATNGTDYNTIALPVRMNAGSSLTTLNVAVIDDLIVDPDETITVSILPSDLYKLDPVRNATLTIQDNDPPTIFLSTVDATADEKDRSTAIVRVTRGGDRQRDLTVNYSVNPVCCPFLGTPATSGSDFVALSGSIAIPAHTISADIIITPIDDSVLEGTEKLLIHLAPNSSYKLGANINQEISILDNELPVVSIIATDGIASEAGPDPGIFTVSRTGPATGDLTVRLSVATGGLNAVLSSDYLTPEELDAAGIDHATVIIPSGRSSQTITIMPRDDSAAEDQEQASMTIVPDPAYTVGTNANAIIFIADND